jgi:hypothetical protein
LNANCPSGIEQDVATVPGTTYVALRQHLERRSGQQHAAAGRAAA